MTKKTPFSFNEAFDKAREYPGLGLDGMDVVMRSYIGHEFGGKDSKKMALKAARNTAGLVGSGKAEVFEGEGGAPKVFVSVLGQGFTMPEDEGLTDEDRKHKKDALWIASGAKTQGSTVLAERAVDAALKIQDPNARQLVIDRLQRDLARFQAVEKLKPRFRGKECILALFAACPQLPAVCEFVDDNVRFV